MACFNYLGNIHVPQEMVDHACELAKNVEKEGIYGVTEMSQHRSGPSLSAFMEGFGLDLSPVDDFNLVTSSVVMSRRLEMHDDSDLFQKYGALIMVKVPDGTVLKQSSGEDIPVQVGDVVSIRYIRKHELHMPNESDRLLFVCVDFRCAKRNLDDRWRSIIQKQYVKGQNLAA